jgi:hypothetical protein
VGVVKTSIRAILKRGKIVPLDELPKHQRDGQGLVVEGSKPSENPTEIKTWYKKLLALSAQIPANDHKRMAAALAEQDRPGAQERKRRATCSHRSRTGLVRLPPQQIEFSSNVRR